MTVLTVGLLSMAVYAVIVALWLHHDKNLDDYASAPRDDRA